MSTLARALSPPPARNIVKDIVAALSGSFIQEMRDMIFFWVALDTVLGVSFSRKVLSKISHRTRSVAMVIAA